MFLTEAAAVSDVTKSRMKSFLSELGITERKPVIVLKEDYFSGYDNRSREEKLEIFKIAADIYGQSEPKDKTDLEAYLKNISFIPSETGEFKLAANLYDSYSTDLKYLLGADHPELFCSNFIGNNAAYREFCLKLGLKDDLKIDAIVQYRTNREDFVELYESVGSSQDYGISTKEFKRLDYDSPTLGTILSGKLTANITSHLIHLLQMILPNQLKESFEWTYYGSKKEVIGPSILCRLLTDASWIARDDQLIRPVDISFDDFCDLYKLPRDNVLQNLNWSNDDIIKQLSEKDQELLKLAREIDPTPEELHEFRRDLIEKRKKTERLDKKMSTQIEEQLNYEEQPVADDATSAKNEGSPDEDAVLEHEYSSSLNASEVYEAADTRIPQTVSTHIAAESNHSNVELEEREVLEGLIDWYRGDGYDVQQQDENKAIYALQKDARVVTILRLVRMAKSSKPWQ